MPFISIVRTIVGGVLGGRCMLCHHSLADQSLATRLLGVSLNIEMYPVTDWGPVKAK